MHHNSSMVTVNAASNLFLMLLGALVAYFCSIIQFLILKISLKSHTEDLPTTSFMGLRVNYSDEVGGIKVVYKKGFDKWRF